MRRLVLFALFAVIPVVVFFYSLKESSYQCDGTFGGESKQSTLYLKVTENRWWVHLWSDNDGRVNLEIPNKDYEVYWLKRNGDQLQLWKDRNLKGLKGNFSLISYSLFLHLDPKIFEGVCKKLENH